MRRIRSRIAALLFLPLGATPAGPALAQELEPRAFTPAPVGTNFVVVGYVRQTGNVFVDPTLPISDIEVVLNGGSLAFGRTFGLAGRQASVTVVAPYVTSTVSGTVFEEQREVTRSGAADLRVRFATNLVGGPALPPREFAAREPTSTLGVSLTVVAPTGQYDPARLVNIGSNRWSFKPEVGLSKPHGPWRFETTGGVWLFARNGEYFGGSRFEQRPVGTVQGHVSYTFRPQLWVSASATYFGGGRTVVNGVERNTLQKNSRVGAQISLPIRRGQTVKLTWARGVATRVGGSFNTIGVAWQYLWF
jgi:hypothetical protein